MNLVVVKFWGAIDSFSNDLFSQYPGNNEMPEFAKGMFECIQYEGKISQLNSGGVIYRVNTDKNCKAISVISTSTTGTKWGGGREGAFLGCTFFIQSSKQINGVHVVKSLENALSTAIEIIEDNNGKVPRLSDELLKILQDISQEAQSCVSQNSNNKTAEPQIITGEICSIAPGEAGESVAKLLNINIQGSLYLIPFIDSQSHFAKKSSPVNALLSRFKTIIDPHPDVPPRLPQGGFGKSKSKIVIGASTFILLLVGGLYWHFHEPEGTRIGGQGGEVVDTDTIEDPVISGIDDCDTLDVSTGNTGSDVATPVAEESAPEAVEEVVVEEAAPDAVEEGDIVQEESDNIVNHDSNDNETTKDKDIREFNEKCKTLDEDIEGLMDGGHFKINDIINFFLGIPPTIIEERDITDYDWKIEKKDLIDLNKNLYRNSRPGIYRFSDNDIIESDNVKTLYDKDALKKMFEFLIPKINENK